MTTVAPRLAAYLDYIHGKTLEKGYPPSMRDIMAAVGLRSLNSTSANMLRLQHHGLLLSGGGRRTLVLPGPPTVLECRQCGEKVKHYAVDPHAPCDVPVRDYIPVLHDCNF